MMPAKLSISLICLMIFTAACDKNDGESHDPSSPEATTTPAEEAAEAPIPELPVTLEQPLIDALKKAVASCKVSTSGNYVSDCPAGEDKAVRELLKTPEARVKAIDTFARLLEEPDEPTVAASASFLYNTYLGGFPPGTTIHPAPAVRLLDAFKKADVERQPLLATPVASILATARQGERLYQALDALPNRQAAYNGHKASANIMRLEAFPKLKELGASSKDADVRAALEAALDIYNLDDQERDTFCPWARGFIEDERPNVARAANRMMIRCRGEYVDAMLDHYEAQIEAGKFESEDTFVVRDVCFSPIKALIDQPGFQAQCDRDYALLQAVVDDERFDSKTRGLSLFSIYYQRRDQKSFDLMQKYKDHADANIKKYANDAIDSLEKHYLKKK